HHHPAPRRRAAANDRHTANLGSPQNMAKTTEPKASEGGAAPAAQIVTPAQAKTLAERAESGEKLSVGELALVTRNLRRVNLPVITTVNRDRSSGAYGRSEIDAQPTAYTA